MLKIKRITDPTAKTDGVRILVERIWPRGVQEEDAQIAEWYQAIAPSDPLRKWFANKAEKWDEFRKRYTIELHKEEARKIVDKLRERAKKETITLIHSGKDEERNAAAVVRLLLMMKID